MQGNKIIVHALIKIDDKYLVIKRSENENVYPLYFDIPGGMINMGEMPTDGLHREVKEEVGLSIKNLKIIHEDSNYDKTKDKVFIRLVYLAELDCSFENLIIDKSEHTEYLLIKDLLEIKGKYVPYLQDVFSFV